MLFDRVSAYWQAKHSPSFHPAAQYRYIRQSSLLQLLRRHRSSAVGFTHDDHRPVVTNQIWQTRRQFIKRHILRPPLKRCWRVYPRTSSPSSAET
jgi:hypothetical protein